MMNSGHHVTRKLYTSLRLLPKISFKRQFDERLGSEVAGGGKDFQQTKPKFMNPTGRTGRHVSTEQPSSSSVQEIENVSNMTATAQMKEKVFLFSSCVSVFVKR